jgi:DNA-binding CsgD family transcriptional regulator
MHHRNGAAAPNHAGDCALRLSEAEHDWLARRLDALTAREREVVRALCLGGSNEVLADRLCVALPTLRTHLMRINQKLGSESKDDIVRFVAARLLDAYRRGELPPQDGRGGLPGASAPVLVEPKAHARAERPDAVPEAGSGPARNHRYR